MIIHPTNSADIPALQHVLEQTELFPAEMLPDMIAPFLATPTGDERWLTCFDDDQAIGLCYARAEPFTDGTWNMLALGVLAAKQGCGAGSTLVRRLEADLGADGHRLLIVDTSGTPDFAGARAFYRNAGYTEEARSRDYWAPGDDKVTFWKTL